MDASSVGRSRGAGRRRIRPPRSDLGSRHSRDSGIVAPFDRAQPEPELVLLLRLCALFVRPFPARRARGEIVSERVVKRRDGRDEEGRSERCRTVRGSNRRRKGLYLNASAGRDAPLASQRDDDFRELHARVDRAVLKVLHLRVARDRGRGGRPRRFVVRALPVRSLHPLQGRELPATEALEPARVLVLRRAHPGLLGGVRSAVLLRVLIGDRDLVLARVHRGRLAHRRSVP